MNGELQALVAKRRAEGALGAAPASAGEGALDIHRARAGPRPRARKSWPRCYGVRTVAAGPEPQHRLPRNAAGLNQLRHVPFFVACERSGLPAGHHVRYQLLWLSFRGWGVLAVSSLWLCERPVRLVPSKARFDVAMPGLSGVPRADTGYVLDRNVSPTSNACRSDSFRRNLADPIVIVPPSWMLLAGK
jgi:hypothetical protein